MSVYQDTPPDDPTHRLAERVRACIESPPEPGSAGSDERNEALSALADLVAVAERARTAESLAVEQASELLELGARVLEYRQALEQIAAMEIADPLPDEDPLLRLARTVARCNAIARDVLGSELGESS